MEKHIHCNFIKSLPFTRNLMKRLVDLVVGPNGRASCDLCRDAQVRHTQFRHAQHNISNFRISFGSRGCSGLH